MNINFFIPELLSVRAVWLQSRNGEIFFLNPLSQYLLCKHIVHIVIKCYYS